MGLSQSLYTGYSGLATHQKSMDNIGNNLANINTTGFKKSEFMFDSLFKQAINGAYQTDGVRGTTNPKNVGMGVSTGAILTNFGASAPESTNNPLDCAITGNGFFMVSTPRGTALTRNGSFYLDGTSDANQRALCLGDGMSVLGWNAVNGNITPSRNVEPIRIPARGDKLPGVVTKEAEIKGILPSNASGSDFAGASSSILELKGNLGPDENSLLTSIYMPVTRSGGENPVKDDVQEVKVRIEFTGPTLSEDGETESYGWTMTTVDWPNAGDEGVQIYPAEDTQNTSVDFYVSGSTTEKHGAGQAKTAKATPGSTRVESKDEDGVTTSFTMPSDFSLDTSRLTHLGSAPGGNTLETWYVNGNPTGTMARTLDMFDEYTSFEAVTEDGVATMQPVRSVETRRNTMFFQRDSADNTGSEWSWKSSLGGDSGTLSFDIHGEMTGSTQTGSRINYNFSDIQSINHEGTLQAASQDGYRDGFMEDTVIDPNGKIWAQYSNGVDLAVAQIAMGTVPNTSGLVNSSGTLFYPGVASGDLMIGVAGDDQNDFGLDPIGASTLATGALESSNVDLSREFANMIAVERGYQFSSRIITTSNELLQTALQLKT